VDNKKPGISKALNSAVVAFSALLQSLSTDTKASQPAAAAVNVFLRPSHNFNCQPLNPREEDGGERFLFYLWKRQMVAPFSSS